VDIEAYVAEHTRRGASPGGVADRRKSSRP
jgi:hypothetical protein